MDEDGQHSDSVTGNNLSEEHLGSSDDLSDLESDNVVFKLMVTCSIYYIGLGCCELWDTDVSEDEGLELEGEKLADTQNFRPTIIVA